MASGLVGVRREVVAPPVGWIRTNDRAAEAERRIGERSVPARGLAESCRLIYGCGRLFIAAVLYPTSKIEMAGRTTDA